MRKLPAGILDGLEEWSWSPGAQVHVALDDDGDRHVVQSGPQGARRPTWWSRAIRGGAAGGRTILAAARHRLLAGPPRRGARLQRPGRGLGGAATGVEGVGFVRRSGGFRRGAGRWVGEARQGRQWTPLAGRRDGAGGAGRTGLGVGDHRLGAAGPDGAEPGTPMWPCWTRRAPVPAAK